MGTMTAMETEEIRQTLAGEQDRLQAIRDDLRAGDDLEGDRATSGGELSNVDQHPADVASEHVQREVTLSMLEQVEAELNDVERAMGKLDDGTYGTCEACGRAIGDERLEAVPTARFCVDDQAKAESEITLRSTVEQAGTTDAETAI